MEALAIICAANLVTVITTISMSAVATNGQIKGGEGKRVFPGCGPTLQPPNSPITDKAGTRHTRKCALILERVRSVCLLIVSYCLKL